MLSEYMRLGSMLGPQAFGTSYRDGGSCALGAVALAAGLTKGTHYEHLGLVGLSERFPILSRAARCSRCSMQGILWLLIVHLNNDHRLTREHIADLVEGWEMQLGLRAIPWEGVREEAEEHEHATSA